jgi:septal ring factor EnvC (AmiA/AmiB activator)
MQITVELTWLIGLFFSFMTVLWAFAKLFGSQFNKNLGERFLALDARFAGIENSLKESSSERHEQGQELHQLNEKLHHVELEIERMQADMPSNFVTRAEWNKSVSDLSSTVNQLVGENRSQTDTLRLILNKMVSNSKGLP